jgi:hypothetical protein
MKHGKKETALQAPARVVKTRRRKPSCLYPNLECSRQYDAGDINEGLFGSKALSETEYLDSWFDHLGE